MVLRLPNLDDTTFEDLVRGSVAAVPRYNRQWTDFNSSDPGVTLIELLSWVAETLLYQLNRVPEETIVDFLRLVAGATGDRIGQLLTELENEGLDEDYIELLKFLQKIENGWKPTRDEIQLATVAFFRAPYLAVTQQDFIALALEANRLVTKPDAPRVARVIVEADAEVVEVILVSDQQETFDLPTYPNQDVQLPPGEAWRVLIGITASKNPYEQLVQMVQTYLEPRILIGTLVEVAPPVFTPVDIDLWLLCDPVADLAAVVEVATAAVVAYLDPLTGGRAEEGWTYDQAPEAGRIADLALAIPAVRVIERVTLSLAPTIELGVLSTLGANTLLGPAPSGLRQPIFFRGLPWLRVVSVHARIPGAQIT